MVGAILTALSLGSSALSAYGQYKQGQSAKDAGQYNYELAQRNAKAVEIAGQEEVRKIERYRKQVEGSTMVGVAVSGIEMTGSPMAVLLDSMTEIEIDKNITQANYETERRRVLSGGEQALTTGKEAAKLGTTNAFATLLKGGASAYSR